LKTNILYITCLSVFLFSSNIAFAQAGTSGSSFVSWGLWAVAILLIFFILISVADNLLGIEASKAGMDDEDSSKFSIFPSAGDFFKPKLPEFAEGKSVKVLSKGHDIKLAGAAEKVFTTASASTYAVQPKNFIGMSPIPKVTVEVGDEVQAGDVLFYDKKRPEVKYVAPVSGEVIAVNRGEKRSIKEVVILADKDIRYKAITKPDLANSSREDLVKFLLENGAWPLIRQRPFDIVPDSADVPTNIFISTFDSAPLAPDLNFVVEGKRAAFQAGLNLLGKLTPGKVHLGLNAKSAPSTVFTEATGVQQNWFHGKHPAGNVGIQIHHTAPISGSDTVWVLGVQDVLTLGTLVSEGRFDASRVVALTGALKKPSYAKTYLGANIGDLVKDNVEGTPRLISGDVLSGKAKSAEEFLNFHDDQITTIKEGKEHEMFGWLLPTTARPSVSQTFLSGLVDITYEPDTNTHGEKRAFVVTGQYEKVLPMDIYPQHLMKAILVNDIERMEGLGINELSEEDIALCEFACTSKQPLQKILRQGLELMREQS